jgi:predicted HTH transcriptional regulator
MISDDQLRKILIVNERGFIKRNESSTIEFKANFSYASLTLYAKTMAAFANNKGGIIVFGVTDHPRRPIGLQNDKFIKLDSSNVMSNLT